MKGMLLVTVFALACSSGSTSTVDGNNGAPLGVGDGGESGVFDAGQAGEGPAGADGTDAAASGGVEMGTGGSVSVDASGGLPATGGDGSGGSPVAAGGSGEGGAQVSGGASAVDCDFPEDEQYRGKNGVIVTCLQTDGSRTCQTGECLQCPLDSLDCDGDPSNGCETPRSYDQCLGCNFPCTDSRECVTLLGTDAVTGDPRYYKACQ